MIPFGTAQAFAALWVLILVLYLKQPPKGPSAQEVQLAFPFYHEEARA
jgi:hypothetical protein